MTNLKALMGIWDTYIVPSFPFIILTYCLWPNIPSNFFLLIKLLVYLIVVYAITKNFKRFLYFLCCDPFVLAITSLACFSVYWSTIPEVTLDSIRNLLVLYFAAIYIAMNYSIGQQMVYFAWTLGAATLLSLVSTLVIPGYGIDTSSRGSSWEGIFRHKNRLANAMVMSVLVFLNLGLADKKWRFTAFCFPLISTILLLLSEGKGALVALLITSTLFLLYWIISQKEYDKKIIFFTVVLYAALATAIALYFGLEYLVVDVLGRDFTLTGRTEMWNYLIERVMTRPMLGFGYNGFWQNSTEALGVFRHEPWFKSVLTGRGNAHSGYIELFLQLGWVGLFLMLVSLLVTLYKVTFLLLRTKKIEFFWALQFLFLIILFNISETNEAWLGSISIGWLFYVIISITSTAEIHKLSRKSSNIGDIQKNPYLGLSTSLSANPYLNK